MEKKSKVYQMAACAIMSALLCVLGPNSLPIGPIPISLTNLVIYLTVYILGAKGSVVSYLIYILLGAIGLPVFSGYQGGVGKIVGPTGGYLVGFIFIALIGGLVIEKTRANIWFTGIALICATAITYLFGTVWFIAQMDCTWGYALSVCVFPFIPFDLGKIVVASVLGKAVRKGLMSAGLLETA